MREEDTKIYHIVRFDVNDTLYIHFKGCNFDCRGCILKKSPWDCHIPEQVRKSLPPLDEVKMLTLEGFQNILSKTRPKKAILGGGEPTIDPLLKDIIELLNERTIHSALLTNGYVLDKKFAEEITQAGLEEICFSIKAFRNEVHKYYTGKSNAKVLYNFRKLVEKEVTLKSESVLIPNLVGAREIRRIVSFIASLDMSIPFRVDGYIPVPSVNWRMATTFEVRKAAELAEKQLENVSYLHSEIPPRGNAINIYPG